MTKVTRETSKRVIKPTTQAAVLDRPRKASNGYKVFFEQVPEKKKKLRLSVCAHTKPSDSIWLTQPRMSQTLSRPADTPFSALATQTWQSTAKKPLAKETFLSASFR